jgi:type VI secretion system protein ImpC
VYFDVEEDRQAIPHAEPDSPFHILIAGDFSGGANRKRAPIEIDRDNYEDVMARLAAEARLQIGDAVLPIRFQEMDDFHPDSLYARLPPFQALRKLRGRLEDGSTFAAAAA